MLILTFTVAAILSNVVSQHPGCRSDRITEFKKHDGVDFIIGGMFPVHYFSGNQQEFVYNRPGLTWIQAMMFALDEINNSSTLLPGIKLGFTIHDTCNEISIALRSEMNMSRSVDSLPGHAANYRWLNATCKCTKPKSSIVGLIGDAASKTTIKVAAMTAATNTPQISYSSTSTDLSAKHHYPTFLRTIPPDNFQAFFIVDILRRFQWKYVNIIASDDDYGRIGINELIPELKRNNICIAIQEIYDIVQDKTRTESVIKRLTQEKEATVIVLWCQVSEAQVVFAEAQKQNLYYRTWIATEAYGSSSVLYNYDYRVVQGLLGIIPASVTYQPFMDHLSHVTPNNSDNNPWLLEYWTTFAGCTLLNNTSPPKYVCPNANENLSILPPNKYSNVIDGVYALAHALQNMITAHGSAKISSNDMFEDGTYLEFVKNVSFLGKHTRIAFDKQGNPDVASFSLTNLKYTNGTLKFDNVGMWNSLTHNITFHSALQFPGQSEETPKSTCADECKPGSYGLRFQDKPCCWQCVRCKDDTVQSEYNQDHCYECPGSMLPNLNQTECVEPDIEFYKAWSISGIVLIILTLITYAGIFATIIIFHVHQNTPIVKALNRNLSYLQLVTMVIALGMPCIFFLHELTEILCGASLFYFVTFQSIIITVVFTKADRLLRIFKASQSGILSKRSTLKSNRVQFITVGLLTFIGLMICTILYSIFHPKVTSDITHGEKVTVVYHCSSDYDTILLVLLGYIFIISLICAVYAFLARKLPEDYNEAKYTSFAMFTSCLSWIMFVPLYFSSSESGKAEIFCYISFISIVVIFLLMYMPKVYIIIFHPEQNTQQVFRNKMKERHVSTGVGSNSSMYDRNYVGRKHGIGMHTKGKQKKSTANGQVEGQRNRSMTFV